MIKWKRGHGGSVVKKLVVKPKHLGLVPRTHKVREKGFHMLSFEQSLEEFTYYIFMDGQVKKQKKVKG